MGFAVFLMYRGGMGKNIIVSEATLRDLLEAQASLSAWYYELSAALRASGGTANVPGDRTRKAHLDRLAADYPEVAAIARDIVVPRPFVPAPVIAAPADLNEVEPLPARGEPPPEPAFAPPPMVLPGSVKYGS